MFTPHSLYTRVHHLENQLHFTILGRWLEHIRSYIHLHFADKKMAVWLHGSVAMLNELVHVNKG